LATTIIKVKLNFVLQKHKTTSLNIGGIGLIKYPLVSDLTKKISTDYGVLIREKGYTMRGLFIIDPKGVIRYIFSKKFQKNFKNISKIFQKNF